MIPFVMEKHLEKKTDCRFWNKSNNRPKLGFSVVTLLGVVCLRLGRANKLSAHLNREENFPSAPFFNTFFSQPWLLLYLVTNRHPTGSLSKSCFWYFFIPSFFNVHRVLCRWQTCSRFLPKLPTNFKGQNR